MELERVVNESQQQAEKRSDAASHGEVESSAKQAFYSMLHNSLAQVGMEAILDNIAVSRIVQAAPEVVTEEIEEAAPEEMENLEEAIIESEEQAVEEEEEIEIIAAAPEAAEEIVDVVEAPIVEHQQEVEEVVEHTKVAAQLSERSIVREHSEQASDTVVSSEKAQTNINQRTFAFNEQSPNQGQLSNTAEKLASDKQQAPGKTLNPELETMVKMLDKAGDEGISDNVLEQFINKGQAQVATSQGASAISSGRNSESAQNSFMLMGNMMNSGELATAAKQTGVQTLNAVTKPAAIVNLGKEDVSERTGERTKTSTMTNLPQSTQQQIIEKIQNVLEQASKTKTNTTLTLRLDPPQLGAMTVKLTHRADEMFARIIPENAEVQALLQVKSAELSNVLAASGIKAENIHVHVGADNSRDGSLAFNEFFNRGQNRNSNAGSQATQIPGTSLAGQETSSQAYTKEALQPSWVA